MRATFLSVAAMASSLLVKEGLAAPHGHANLHAKRDYYLDTDHVIVTEEVWVTQAPDGSLATGAALAIGTRTIDGSPFLVTQPEPAPTVAPAPGTPEVPVVPAPTPATSSAAAVDVEEKASSTPIYVAPTTSEAPVVVPTPAASSPVHVEPTTPIYVIPTTSKSAAPVASTTASPSGSGKRGLAYNDANLLSAFTGSSKISWAYNWGSTISGTMPSGVEYIPMLWGLVAGDVSNWHEAAESGLKNGATALLAFNEPDHTAQANLGPAAAATGYLANMQPYAGRAKLVSPAVTNGGAPMGLTWLESFMTACTGCTIDAVAIHWYNGGDAAAFKEYMAKAYTAGGNRPLWITEFQAPGSTEEQKTFLTEVMAWMDATSYIERYAYFMVADGNLVSGSTLNSLGSTYASSK
ncbi:hypothetical protein QTJ16_006210 [Diplocarpon rosae]|uniref:Asl1-like glycosyl hydrolase catalytic domain-containing protein n=1 Tax=Diplocarpon rosae TaxID=946125 RepID=A0AAD9SX06_9HELO|nr:hypothetical protein QTJ16_006210 [Diplocarpon rosae]PBP23908.1 hypothetical protein BUE80_DR005079 [Diplocarpon rosae]